MSEQNDVSFAELFDLLGITDSDERLRLSRHIFVAEALNEKELAKFVMQLTDLLRARDRSNEWQELTSELPEAIYRALVELDEGEYVTFDMWMSQGSPVAKGAPIVIFTAEGSYSVTRAGNPDAEYWKTRPLVNTTILAVRPLSEATYKELTKDGTAPIRRVSYDPTGTSSTAAAN